MRQSLQTARRFTHLRVENWRNFQLAEFDLQRRAFLIGPNASSKSNLLDAFRFLRDIVKVGGCLQEATRRHGGVSSLRCLSARSKSHVRIAVQVGTSENPELWSYTLEFNQDRGRSPKLSLERVQLGDAILLDRPDVDDRGDPERMT